MSQPDPSHEAATSPPERRPARVGPGLLVAVLMAILTAVAGVGLWQADAATTPVAATQSTTQDSSTNSIKVAIKNYAFSPGSLTVHVGDTVTWTNDDTAPHTVTTSSGPKSFDSGELQKGQSWSYTFTTPGTYQYYCAVHPDMTASVTVVSGGGGGGPSPTPTPTPTSTPTTSPTSGPTASPSGSPTVSPSDSMSGMPSSSPSSTNCASMSQVLLPIFQHINNAHLRESPSQQVADLLNFDQWIKTHTVWLESILSPLTTGGQNIETSVVTTFLNHIKTAHLDESVGQQVQDLLNTDQWIKTHTVWASMMLQPVEDFITTNC